MNTRTTVLTAMLGIVLVGAGCTTPSAPVPVETEDVERPVINVQEQEESNAPTLDELMENRVSLEDFDASPTSLPGVLNDEELLGKSVTLKTSKGEITIELNGEKAPLTVSNFLVLSKTGFYDGLTFHRYEPDFVIQGGDPEGTGRGGPGYTVPAEITDLKHTKYAVATARLGDAVNPERASSGSQFYITLSATPFLDNAYTVFGYVTAGEEVVDALRASDTIESVEIL